MRENGFDGGHVWIHRDSKLVKGNDIALPLGFVYRGDQRDNLTRIEADGDGPYGVYALKGEGSLPVWEAEDRRRRRRHRNRGSKRLANDVSVWLPGCVRVDPWPDTDCIQYEWYVPRDADSHHYVQCVTKLCADGTQADAFEKECEGNGWIWRYMALTMTTSRFAEVVQDFYGSDIGWTKEVLYETDVPILEWRKLARVN